MIYIVENYLFLIVHTQSILIKFVSSFGVIFSDGIEAGFMEFNSGMETVIAPAARSGLLAT